jgi:HD superfamily phosphodiesterase
MILLGKVYIDKMSTDIMQAVAHYAEEVMGGEGFRYVSAVVANCKMLALELEALEEEEGRTTEVDRDALVIAAFLHDISTVEYGFQEHQVKSAEMAEEFLRELDVPAEQVEKVKQIILEHTMTSAENEDSDQEDKRILEGRILYDADKLGRLSGLAIVTSLIEFGARYPNRAVTGEVLAAILRHIEERFIELYQSVNTVPARTMAREKFNNALAFLDGVIEHLNDATPV